MTKSYPNPRTYDRIVKPPINKLSLELAEKALLSYYETEIRRHSSRQIVAMNKGKVGRPFIYSKILIEYAAILLYLRDLSYRILQVELELRTGISVSKSQLQERIANLLIDINIGSFLQDKLLDVAIDATGFRPTERGLWRIVQHEEGKISERNGYVKLSIVNDTESKYILSAFVGDAQTADITLFDPCLEDTKGYSLRRFYGDGSFDAFHFYKKCIERGITPVAKPDKNAIVKYSRKTGLARDVRSSYVKLIKEAGYKEWSRRLSYGKRWSSEIVFSKFKRLFGDVLRSRKEQNIAQEFTIKIWIYNALTALQRGYNIFVYFLSVLWRVVGQPTTCQ